MVGVDGWGGRGVSPMHNTSGADAANHCITEQDGEATHSCSALEHKLRAHLVSHNMNATHYPFSLSPPSATMRYW